MGHNVFWLCGPACLVVRQPEIWYISPFEFLRGMIFRGIYPKTTCIKIQYKFRDQNLYSKLRTEFYGRCIGRGTGCIWAKFGAAGVSECGEIGKFQTWNVSENYSVFYFLFVQLDIYSFCIEITIKVKKTCPMNTWKWFFERSHFFEKKYHKFRT